MMSVQSPMTRVKVAVIGKGLIGSAAARHLAARTEGVALVGPDEPSERAERQDAIYGSHYDEGRIYRILDPNQIWARLAARALARYEEIEAESGIQFHQEVGLLGASPPGDIVARYARTGAALGVEFEPLDRRQLTARFPYLSFPDSFAGVFQGHQAGHISPRRMVDAQTRAAERRGATIIRESVHRLRMHAEGAELTTSSGKTVYAERALVATGAFANLHDLLPRPLDITVGGRTVVLAEVSEALLPRLGTMPSLILEGTAPVADPYILPPIQYPDGRWYVKLGSGVFEHPLVTAADFQDWFRGSGGAEDREGLHRTLVNVIPDLVGAPVHTDTCAVTSTVGGYPYVDLIADGRVGLAVGGNGQAAKSADEIGRLAGELLLYGEWRDDLPREVFQAHFRA